MPSISATVVTKYSCNNNFVEDNICLQSRIFLNSLLTQEDQFQGVLIFEIAGIFGPYYNQNCKHNRSPLY